MNKQLNRLPAPWYGPVFGIRSINHGDQLYIISIYKKEDGFEVYDVELVFLDFYVCNYPIFDNKIIKILSKRVEEVNDRSICLCDDSDEIHVVPVSEGVGLNLAVELYCLGFCAIYVVNDFESREALVEKQLVVLALVQLDKIFV